MRVLFTTALVAALASAGSAPAPTGNTAKRNGDPHLAPHRFDKTKTLIAAGQADGDSGAGQLDLRVVLKADDGDRSRQEIHTTLTLSGIDLTEGQELYLGWAMRPSNAEDINLAPVDNCTEGTVCGALPTDKLDGQGT